MNSTQMISEIQLKLKPVIRRVSAEQIEKYQSLRHKMVGYNLITDIHERKYKILSDGYTEKDLENIQYNDYELFPILCDRYMNDIKHKVAEVVDLLDIFEIVYGDFKITDEIANNVYMIYSNNLKNYTFDFQSLFSVAIMDSNVTLTEENITELV